MDKTITINKRALEAHINTLESLINKIDTAPILSESVEDLEGSGDIIFLINEINAIYKQIAEDYKTLISNSVNFFKNVLNSTSKADEESEKFFE